MDAQQQELLDSMIAEKYEPIAIVGMSMRFPGGVNNAEEFQNMLSRGEEGIAEIPSDRWSKDDFFHSEKNRPGKTYTHNGGYLDKIDEFDPSFFSISPKEANNIDPQQRITLELAWEALENANIDPNILRGTRGGVYVGVSTVDYARELTCLAPEQWNSQMGTGSANSAISGRVSYFLGLKGPCLSVDTACSSSLVAVHLAVNGLRNKESDIAICAGVNVIHNPSSHVIFSHANMLAPDGRCKTFDESADGYGRSEGSAVLVLKRLSDAIKDQNEILALVRGTSVQQDGESGGLTVPNGKAQEAVMRDAIQRSMLDPAEINYVEAHGTGTPLGDPIEINAIDSVFRQDVNRSAPLKVASAKTNLGHMEATAGMGGLIKVILQLQSSTIFPHRNMKNPSSNINWSDLCVEIPTTLSPWLNENKCALVNSFGFAGTIASIVLEQGQQFNNRIEKDSAEFQLLTLSAKTSKALRKQIENYQQSLEDLPKEQFSQFCQTSNTGRSHFNYRVAIEVKSISDAQVKLQKLLSENKILESIRSQQEHNNKGKLAFLFTGQGSQSLSMGMDFYYSNQCFRQYADECDKLFKSYLGESILSIIKGEVEGSEVLLNQTKYTQPALFTIEYAMAKTLSYWGCKPTILIGHSIGEIVAACFAGLFSLPDAIKLVVHRARLMQSINQAGGMLAIHAPKNVVEKNLAQYSKLDFAAINAPTQCVVSGDKQQISELAAKMVDDKISCKELPVSHAFHSSHMEEIYSEFRSIIDELSFQQPRLTFISNLTGTVAKYSEVSTGEYWLQHLRRPVNFLQGIETINAMGTHVFIEVGPSPHLIGLGKQSNLGKDNTWIPCFKANSCSFELLNSALKNLYNSGFNLDWKKLYKGKLGSGCQLPYYPFDKKRFWLPKAALSSSNNYHPLLGSMVKEKAGTYKFTAEISPESPSYIQEHLVMNKVVFPAAGYMEIVLAMQDAICGHSQNVIQNFNILTPLFLEENHSTTLVTTASLIENGHYNVEISSIVDTSDEQQKTRLHLTCNVSNKNDSVASMFDKSFTLESPRPLGKAVNFDKADMYNKFVDVGLRYGTQFQRVEYVEKDTQSSVYAHILPMQSAPHEILNPTLLDAVLHTMESIVPDGKTYLPVGFDKFQLFRKPRGFLEAKVQLHASPSQPNYDISADLMMFSEGELIFAAYGLGLKEVKKVPTTNEISFLHQLSWKKAALNPDDFMENSALIIDSSNIYRTSTLVQSYPDNLSVIDSVDNVIEHLNIYTEIQKIVWFWKTNKSQEGGLLIEKEIQSNIESLLSLIHILEDQFSDRGLELLLVTQGGQILPGFDTSANDIGQLVQSIVGGFNTVIRSEHGRFQSKCIDLDPDVSDENKLKTVIQELFLSQDMAEQQVAFRGGQRFVTRITPQDEGYQKNFELLIEEYGTLSSVTQTNCISVDPTGDEIQVKVKAVGVNFKDVLNALGMLKQHAEDTKQAYIPLPLGFECSGIVLAAGKNAEFKPGDEVIISQLGCMQRYLTVSSKVAVRKPSNISFEQAAGISTAYITSYYSLYNLAKLKSGEKVLIHAAAGGVGQASVQLAKRIGAEVFATASKPKWDFLQSQEIKHIYDSRSLDFKEKIKYDTKKQGVDVVLNSLNKDFIPASIETLSQTGRFIEIGKIGVWSNEQVSQLRSDVSYFNFDLSEFPKSELDLINKTILEDIVSWIESEEITPIKVTSYSLNNIGEAFGLLSRGQNLGKVVINFDEYREQSQQKPASVYPNSQYLITGGFGALGQLAAQWLKENGATNIALLGRNIPSSERQLQIKEKLNNCEVSFLSCDISDKDSVQSMLASLCEKDTPLKGIIHAAGVIDDAPISGQSWEKFSHVFAAKVFGSWWLSSLTDELALDFFVSYSSIASIVGSVSQVNYAAANAFIDQLMHSRAANNQHGLSINWGPWADAGMAANLSVQQIRSIEDKGFKYIKHQEGMACLTRLLINGVTQGIVGEYDWAKYTASLPHSNNLYQDVTNQVENNESDFDISMLNDLSENDQEQMILNKILSIIAKVLQYDDSSSIEPTAKFSELGLDSLVAVELRNMLEKTFKSVFPSSLVFDYPSIPKLNDLIVTQLKGKQKLVDSGKVHSDKNSTQAKKPKLTENEVVL